MKYEGKLYGGIRGKYIPLQQDTDYVDLLESIVADIDPLEYKLDSPEYKLVSELHKQKYPENYE